MMLELVDFHQTEELWEVMGPFAEKLLELQGVVSEYYPHWLTMENGHGDEGLRDRYIRISTFMASLLPGVCEGILVHSKELLFGVAFQLVQHNNEKDFVIHLGAGDSLMSASAFGKLSKAALEGNQVVLQNAVVKALVDVVYRMEFELNPEK